MGEKVEQWHHVIEVLGIGKDMLLATLRYKTNFKTNNKKIVPYISDKMVMVQKNPQR